MNYSYIICIYIIYILYIYIKYIYIYILYIYIISSSNVLQLNSAGCRKTYI